MTLEELQAKLPEEFRPWAVQYGPVFVAMTAEEIKAWIDRLIAGEVTGAYRDVLTKLANAELLGAGDQLVADWNAANAANKAKIDLQKSALYGLLGILLKMALVAVGL